MILVTGATGHVGGELVSQLTARHQPVRAMSRRPHSMDLPPGAEAVYGDCEDPASLDAAFDGVDRVFLMSAQAMGSAPYPTHALALSQAAQRAGVQHVVGLSVYTGGGGGDAIGEWAGQIEDAIKGSGKEWTLLRPGRFMSNALHWAPMIRNGDTVTIPFAGRASASIDPADVAAVALAALTTGRHTNVAYQLTGPQVLTPAEELEILAQILGRELRAVEPSDDSVRKGMASAGTPDDVIDAIMARTLGDDGKEVLPTVDRILGRPPAAFADWAAAHAGLFTETVTETATETITETATETVTEAVTEPGKETRA